MLVFTTGLMAAGKSLKCIETFHMLKGKMNPMEIVVLVPHIKGQSIVSKNGMSIAAIEIRPNDDLILLYSGAKLVLVDEVQFCTIDQIRQLKRLSSERMVFVYGLRADYRAALFPASAELLRLADEINILASKCTVCNSFAEIDRLVSGDTSTNINVEGKYTQLCGACDAGKLYQSSTSCTNKKKKWWHHWCPLEVWDI